MKHNKLLLYAGLVTALLVVVTAAFGLMDINSYAAETKNWQVQGIAQDAVDIFLISPALLVALAGAWRGSRFFAFLLGGILLFLAYSYVIYCFSVHFNAAFLLYCLVLGLSVYLFIYLFTIFPAQNAIAFFTSKTPVRSIAVYLAVIAVIFYALWLSDIIPAITQGKAPAMLAETGLLTNPVHVLDLSLLLPGMLICSVMLYKKRPIAFFLAPVLLIFCILMNINIAVLAIMMAEKGMGEGYFIVYVMILLALAAAWLLYRFCRQLIPRLLDKDHDLN